MRTGTPTALRVTRRQRAQLEKFTLLCFTPDHLSTTSRFLEGMLWLAEVPRTDSRLATMNEILNIEGVDPEYREDGGRYIDEARVRAKDYIHAPELCSILHFVDSMLDHVDLGDSSASKQVGESIISFFSFYIGYSLGLWQNSLPDGPLPNTLTLIYPERPVRTCAGPDCEAKGKEFSACAGCREVFYCSKLCQRRDWKAGGHNNRCAGRAGR